MVEIISVDGIEIATSVVQATGSHQANAMEREKSADQPIRFPLLLVSMLLWASILAVLPWPWIMACIGAICVTVLAIAILPPSGEAETHEQGPHSGETELHGNNLIENQLIAKQPEV